MKSLTAPNARILLSISGLYTVPQELQGFAADDVTDLQSVNSAEISMGVDGKLSGGYVHIVIPQGIMLQADSDSNDLFDTWFTSQQAAGELFYASGIIRLPSVSKSYALTRGILTGFTPMPAVKRVLQPRKYEITWQSILPAPI